MLQQIPKICHFLLKLTNFTTAFISIFFRCSSRPSAVCDIVSILCAFSHINCASSADVQSSSTGGGFATASFHFFCLSEINQHSSVGRTLCQASSASTYSFFVARERTSMFSATTRSRTSFPFCTTLSLAKGSAFLPSIPLTLTLIVPR